MATSKKTGRPGRDAFLIFLGRGTRAVGMGILSVLIALYLDAIGLGTAQIGFVLGLSLAGGVAVSIVVMVAGPLLSRRAWFVSLALITAAAGVLLLVTDNLALLCFGSFFGGYAATGMHVGPVLQLEQAALAQVATAGQRTRAFAHLSIFSAGGRAFGSFLAGLTTLLINVFDLGQVDAYRIILGLYVGFNGLAAVAYFGLSPAIEIGRSAAASFVNPLRAKSRNRILLLSGLFGVDSLAGGLIVDVFVSYWLFNKFGANESTISAVLIAGQVVNIASIWVAPRLALRIGLVNTLVWTQVVGNALLVAFALAPVAPLAYAIWVVRDFFNEMDVPTRQSYVMAIVPPDERVAMAGTNNLGRAVFRMPSSIITGALWAGGLSVAPWLVGAGMKLSYNLALYAAFRNVRPPEETTQAAPEARPTSSPASSRR